MRKQVFGIVLLVACGGLVYAEEPVKVYTNADLVRMFGEPQRVSGTRILPPNARASALHQPQPGQRQHQVSTSETVTLTAAELEQRMLAARNPLLPRVGIGEGRGLDSAERVVFYERLLRQAQQQRRQVTPAPR